MQPVLPGGANPGTARRYPGVRPFVDTASDREIFRGREKEIRRLRDLILSERVVTVFARSGLGKSSLLNAGLSEPLRAEGLFPVPVRIAPYASGLRSPLELQRLVSQSLTQALADKSASCGVEFIRGQGASLPELLRTAELWQKDELLVPVLIFDQFEEIFTLLNAEQRKIIAGELALLAGHSNSQHTMNRQSSPSVKVVFALREDFVADLEDLTRDIPSILKNRFRLGGLTLEQARAAIVEPAGLTSPRFRCPPFTWDTPGVEAVLLYLAAAHEPRDNAVIEPFQLQLVCQYAENLIAAASARGEPKRNITLTDIAAPGKLTEILTGFYEASIHSVAEGIDSSAVPAREVRLRRLCEVGLITETGRRRLLEESDILGRFAITRPELHELVEARLLRCEARADTRYYELTHDALIEPIRQEHQRHRARKRRIRGLVAASSGIALISCGAVLLWRFARADVEHVRQEALQLKREGEAQGQALQKLQQHNRQYQQRSEAAEQLLGVELKGELGRAGGKWVTRLWLAGEIPDLLESVTYALEAGSVPTLRSTSRDAGFCGLIEVDADIERKRCPVIHADLHTVFGASAARNVRACQVGETDWLSTAGTEYLELGTLTVEDYQGTTEAIRERGVDVRVYSQVLAPGAGKERKFALAIGPVGGDVTRVKKVWKAQADALSKRGVRLPTAKSELVPGARYVDQVYPVPVCAASNAPITARMPVPTTR